MGCLRFLLGIEALDGVGLPKINRSQKPDEEGQ
jgi:hypothetical protein